MIQPTVHYNMIGHEINESMAFYPNADREVFCKKLHKVCVPQRDDCMACEYFNGVMQGYGHECVWDDQVRVGETEQTIPWEDRNKEMMRVSKLIDEGYLKKG